MTVRRARPAGGIAQRQAEAALVRDADAPLDPEAQAWERLLVLLHGAYRDPIVAQSKNAQVLLRVLFLHVRTAETKSADAILAEMVAGFQSVIASMAVPEENTMARAWVVEEWHLHCAAGESRNKSFFARLYKVKVWEKFGLHVDVRTIKERWLKGA